ncbi:MAG: tetratricopeptide repeat protein [Sandaracinaceae bacterium]|nr:tetratricopeptide repeat protein [Sandaracinaceae bacterium]
MSLLDRAARFIDDVLLLPDDVRDTLEQAEHALEQGVPEHAEPLFREVLAERPSLLRARQGLALALEARGDVAGARAILAVSRQLDPDEPEVALLSARLALAANDLDAAVGEARDAARRLAQSGGASFAEACLIQARAEVRRGRPDRAARELRKAIAAQPEGGRAPRGAGRGAGGGRPRRAGGGRGALHREGRRGRRGGRAARARALPRGGRARARGRCSSGRRPAARRPRARSPPSASRLASCARRRPTRAPPWRVEAAPTRSPRWPTSWLRAIARARRPRPSSPPPRPGAGTRSCSGAPSASRRSIAPPSFARLADRLERLAPGDHAARAARAWAALGLRAARRGGQPRRGALGRAAPGARGGASGRGRGARAGRARSARPRRRLRAVGPRARARRPPRRAPRALARHHRRGGSRRGDRRGRALRQAARPGGGARAGPCAA